jgi:hypothetical protein
MLTDEDQSLIRRALKLHELPPGPESAQQHTGEADPTAAAFVALGEAKYLLGELARRLQQVGGS